MARHLIRIVIIISLLVLITFYPFFPGEYDRLAVPLSEVAQVFGMVRLLLVPVGLLWFLYELRKTSRTNQNLPAKPWNYRFALVALLIGKLIALIAFLFRWAANTLSVGVVILAGFAWLIFRLVPKLKQLRREEPTHFNPVSLYITLIPSIVFLLQVGFAAQAVEFSRNRAIENSSEFISIIEEYHAEHGQYPTSFSVLNPDFLPSVVGIDVYHYALGGEAYNLYFAQPVFLYNLVTREIVVYNKLDEHFIPSHAYWLVAVEPESLMAEQGWYAAHDTAFPHWKYFWFD